MLHAFAGLQAGKMPQPWLHNLWDLNASKHLKHLLGSTTAQEIAQIQHAVYLKMLDCRRRTYLSLRHTGQVPFWPMNCIGLDDLAMYQKGSRFTVQLLRVTVPDLQVEIKLQYCPQGEQLQLLPLLAGS